MRFLLLWIVPLSPVIFLIFAAEVLAQTNGPAPASAPEIPSGLLSLGINGSVVGIVIYSVCNAVVALKQSRDNAAHQAEKAKMVESLFHAEARATICEADARDAKVDRDKAIQERDAARTQLDEERRHWHDRERHLVIELARRTGSDYDLSSTKIDKPK